MSKTTDNTEYELIFNGPIDHTKETIERLKGVMSKEFGLSSYAVDMFFKKAPITIRRATKEEDLEDYLAAIVAAGGDATITLPEQTPEEGFSVEVVKSPERQQLEEETSEFTFEFEEAVEEEKPPGKEGSDSRNAGPEKKEEPPKNQGPPILKSPEGPVTFEVEDTKPGETAPQKPAPESEPPAVKKKDSDASQPKPPAGEVIVEKQQSENLSLELDSSDTADSDGKADDKTGTEPVDLKAPEKESSEPESPQDELTAALDALNKAVSKSEALSKSELSLETEDVPPQPGKDSAAAPGKDKTPPAAEQSSIEKQAEPASLALEVEASDKTPEKSIDKESKKVSPSLKQSSPTDSPENELLTLKSGSEMLSVRHSTLQEPEVEDDLTLGEPEPEEPLSEKNALSPDSEGPEDEAPESGMLNIASEEISLSMEKSPGEPLSETEDQEAPAEESEEERDVKPLAQKKLGEIHLKESEEEPPAGENESAPKKGEEFSETTETGDEFPPPESLQKAKRSVFLGPAVTIVIMVSFLGALNWAYYSHKNKKEMSRLIRSLFSSSLFAKIQEQAASMGGGNKRPPPPKVQYWEGIKDTGDFKADLKFTTIDGRISSTELDIVTKEPPPATPEQIVHNLPGDPWMKKITASRLDVVQEEDGTFTAKGIARIAVRYDDDMHRLVADLNMSGKVDRENSVIQASLVISRNIKPPFRDNSFSIEPADKSFNLFLKTAVDVKFLSELKYEKGGKKKKRK